MNHIEIQGAKLHNLKNLSISIPKHKFTVATGISGCGKSSLIFDILFEEGRKQYLQSLGILSELSNEDKFDSIRGLGPTIAVKQNLVKQNNPRSTVGSKTGLLNKLTVLFSGECTDSYGKHLPPAFFSYNAADGMCMKCNGLGSYYELQTNKLIPDKSILLHTLFEEQHITSGFLKLLKKKFDVFWNMPFEELPSDIQAEILYGHYENDHQSYSFDRIYRTRMEKGEDVSEIYEKVSCCSCHGFRIGEDARNITLNGHHIGELGLMELNELAEYLQALDHTYSFSAMSRNLLKEMNSSLKHLIDFRLGHLTLYRDISTLSGGELQRLFLYSHLETKLDSLIYVFDEPTAGLHPSEKVDTIRAVKALKDIGNTVIAIEHDPYAISQAEHIIDIGPLAGINGGQLVYEGSYEGLLQKPESITGQFLSGHSPMPIRNKMSADTLKYHTEKLLLSHACTNNLKDLTISFPLHALVGISGKSGSGKSTLISDTLLPKLRSCFRHSRADSLLKTEDISDTAAVTTLKGTHLIDGFAEISQAPIGRNSSSTPASYIGIWDKIREFFATATPSDCNLTAGYFSFNSLGACPVCKGSGSERIRLGAELYMEKCCPACDGKRFNDTALSVKFAGKTISDVLSMSINDACEFFAAYPAILAPLQILKDTGMGYLKLGQPTSTLSGGEAQRIKLAKELGRKRTGNILYVLDEPTTGLSQYDTAKLLLLLDHLVSNGNSVLVIEHNTQLLGQCDWLIELGPQGGKRGGYLISEGTCEELKKNPASLTGRYL